MASNARAEVGVDADVGGAVRGLRQVGDAGINMGQKLSGASKMIAGAGAGLTSLGSSITMGVTVPIIGASAALLALGQEFDTVSRTLIEMTGKTGKELAGLANLVKKTYTKVPDSLEDITAAYGYLTQRTDAHGKHLEELATSTLELAKITGSDLQDTIRQSTRMFGDWSIATDEQAVAMDRVYGSAIHTGIKVNDLMRTVVQFGAPLRALGFNFEDSITMLAKWEKEGVNVQTVLAGMKMGLGGFVAEGKDPAKELKKTFAAISDAATLPEAYDIAYKTFGKRAATDIARAVIEQRFNLAKLTKQIENGSLTIAEAAENAWSPWEKLVIIWHQIKVAFTPMADFLVGMLIAVLPYLEKFLDRFMELLKPMKKWSQQQKAIAFGIAAIAAAIGPLITLFGFLLMAIGSVIPLIELLASAFVTSAIGSAIVAAFVEGGFVAGISAIASVITYVLPYIAIFVAALAAIVAVVAAVGYALYKNWDKIGPVVLEVAGTIKNALVDAWNYAVNAIGQAVAWLQETWPKIVAGAENVYNAVVTYFSDMYKRLEPQISDTIDLVKEKYEEIKKTSSEFIDDLVKTADALWKWLSPILDWTGKEFLKFVKWIAPYWKDFWDGAGKQLLSIIELVVSVLSSIFTSIANVIGFVMATIRGDWDDAWHHLVALATSVGEMVIEVFWGIIHSMVGFAQSWTAITNGLADAFFIVLGWIVEGVWWMVKKIVVFFAMLPVKLHFYLAGLVEDFVGWLWNLVKLAASTAAKIHNHMGKWLGEKIFAAWNWLKDRISGWGTKVLGIFQGITADIKSVWLSATNAIIGFINAIIRAFNKLPGKDIGELNPITDTSGPSWATSGTGKRAGHAEPVESGDALGAITSRMPSLPKVPNAGILQGVATAIRAHFMGIFKNFWDKAQISGSGAKGLMGILGRLQGLFPGISVSSLLRPGAVTASGNTSLHALGRAADLTGPPGLMQSLFSYLVQNAKMLHAQEIIYRNLIWTPSQGLHNWPRNDHFDHVHFGVLGDGQGTGGNTYDLRGALFAEDAAKVIFELSRQGAIKVSRQAQRTQGVTG